jgi:hypothetical protein
MLLLNFLDISNSSIANYIICISGIAQVSIYYLWRGLVYNSVDLNIMLTNYNNILLFIQDLHAIRHDAFTNNFTMRNIQLKYFNKRNEVSYLLRDCYKSTEYFNIAFSNLNFITEIINLPDAFHKNMFKEVLDKCLDITEGIRDKVELDDYNYNLKKKSLLVGIVVTSITMSVAIAYKIINN